MIKRTDTSGRVVSRKEHEDDANDIISMSIADWNGVLNKLKILQSGVCLSKACLMLSSDNGNAGEIQNLSQKPIQGEHQNDNARS